MISTYIHSDSVGDVDMPTDIFGAKRTIWSNVPSQFAYICVMKRIADIYMCIYNECHHDFVHV